MANAANVAATAALWLWRYARASKDPRLLHLVMHGDTPPNEATKNARGYLAALAELPAAADAIIERLGAERRALAWDRGLEVEDDPDRPIIVLELEADPDEDED